MFDPLESTATRKKQLLFTYWRLHYKDSKLAESALIFHENYRSSQSSLVSIMIIMQWRILRNESSYIR